MTVFDLFDSVGNIDDELIENAAKQKKSHKRLFYCAASMAACITIACVSLFVLQANQGKLIPSKAPDAASSSTSDAGDAFKKTTTESPESTTGEASENTTSESSENAMVESPENKTSEGSESTTGENSEITQGETSAEIELLRESYKVYYVKDGKIESKTQECDAAPKEVFELWKKANNIGDEVHFISVKLEDNGTESYYEFSGMQIAQYTPGDYEIYYLTVTRNLENYYGENKELLLESLKKTMTGMSDPEPDEYVLTFDDEEQADTESKTSDNT